MVSDVEALRPDGTIFGTLTPSALERLIYVVGSARGGTTITRDVLSTHDSVFALPGPSHFLNHVWRYRRRVHDRLWRVIFWTPGFVNRNKLNERLAPELVGPVTDYINSAFDSRAFRRIYELYPVVRALLSEDPSASSSCTAWLDKGNDLNLVELLPHHYPAARMVQLVRDPRGAVSSLAHRSASVRLGIGKPAAAYDVVSSAIYWRNLTQRQLRLTQKYPEQSIVLRFEDLLRSPETMVPALHDALDLTQEPAATTREKLADLIYSASNEGGAGQGLSTAPVERWRSSLDDQTAALITAICGPTAKKLGYDLSDTRVGRGSSMALRNLPSLKHRAMVAAKLAYLAAVEPTISMPSVRRQPYRLLAPQAA